MPTSKKLKRVSRKKIEKPIDANEIDEIMKKLEEPIELEKALGQLVDMVREAQGKPKK